MSRNPLWTAIAETLSGEIAAQHYRPGDKLPTEAELAARFGVNRHTVRRALAALAEAGTTHARRGSGVYVAARPVDYAIGRRVRYHSNLAAQSHAASRRALRLETRHADPAEAERLRLPPGAPVHVYEGISLADGAPLALFRSLFPAARFPDLPAALRGTDSVTRALAAGGLADYTRAETRIAAELASPTQAGLLQIREGAPILRSEAVNVDPEGAPVEYGLTWFAGDRVVLTVAPD